MAETECVFYNLDQKASYADWLSCRTVDVNYYTALYQAIEQLDPRIITGKYPDLQTRNI
jgi:hypothetical protein